MRGQGGTKDRDYVRNVARFDFLERLWERNKTSPYPSSREAFFVIATEVLYGFLEEDEITRKAILDTNGTKTFITKPEKKE